MTGLTLNQLRDFWESKYTTPFEEVKDSLTLINISDLGKARIINFGKDTIVILTDGNISSLQWRGIYFNCKQILGFMCYDYDFHLVKSNRNIIYLQDYRIHGVNKHFISYDYVKKIPFSEYNSIVSSPIENIGLLYVTWACKKVDRDTIIKYHKRSKCDTSILVVPNLIEEFNNISNITQVKAPLLDFFNSYSTYIYTPVARQFDCSSRLIVESIFYNKKVFVDVPYKDVALEVRLEDARSRLESLNLTDNDSILEILEKYKR